MKMDNSALNATTRYSEKKRYIEAKNNGFCYEYEIKKMKMNKNIYSCYIQFSQRIN